MELILVVFVITSCLSVSCGQSFVTDNTFVQQTTEEFNRYCPHTKTCVIDTNKKKHTGLRGSRKPCCNNCNCLNTCGLNCCPDKLFSFTNEKDFYDAKELIRCVGAQYSTFLSKSYRPFWFEMISNCPFNYADGKTVKQCRREYRDYDFQTPLRNLLPAFDRTEKRIYKNIFCAICHNADINDLDFALLTYRCEYRPSNLTYIHDLVWNISRADGNCNFEFFPKEYDLWANEKCDKRNINRCNVTEKWEKYDRQLEEKCLSYRSEYQWRYDNVYRNVHCFLCNGFSEDDIVNACSIRGDYPSIMANLDFRELLSEEDDNDHTSYVLLKTDDIGYNLCQNEAIYNVSQVETWNLECPFGMVLSDNTCFPPSLPNVRCPFLETMFLDNPDSPTCFPEEHIVSMYVSLLLEPDHSQLSQHETSLFAFLSLISTEVQNIFFGLVTRDLFLDYHITVPIDLEAVPTRNTTIDFGSRKKIPIHTKVTLDGIKDIILPILDFSLQFNDFERMGDFKIKICRQNPLIHDNITSPCFFHDYLPRSVLHCPDNNSDASNYYIRITGAKNNINDKTSSVPAVSIGVEREPFCPRIALKKLAFVGNTEACKDIHILCQILTDDFLSKQLSENETHMFFCYKDYLQHLKDLKLQDVTHSGRDAYKLAFIYLTMACLSASCVSLLTTIIIYAVFPVLRTLPGLNIMALSVNLLVYHFLSLVSTITPVNILWLCSLIGIVTHFSMIQSFCWMFICTYHMMKVFIKIRSKAVQESVSRKFIIYVICAVLVATTLVAITIIVAEVKSGGRDIGYGGDGCYIKDLVMIMCVAALPVVLVVILNFCMFCVVLFKISRLPSLAASKQNERQNTVIFIKLSTLTGLSSVFGFLLLFTELYIFGYLFVVFNGGQGVFIMISFIFNRRVRDLVQGLISGGSRTGS